MRTQGQRVSVGGPPQPPCPTPQVPAHRATTRNWSICRSVRGLSGSHTFISIFCWFRLSDSPEGVRGRGEGGVQAEFPHPVPQCPPLTRYHRAPPYLRPAGLGFPPGTCSQLGSRPGQPGGFSGRGRTPASRRSSPGRQGGEGGGGLSWARGACPQISPHFPWWGMGLTSFSRYWPRMSVSLSSVTLHFPLQGMGQGCHGEAHTPPGAPPTTAGNGTHRMWVAGSDSNCRERKSSRCFSW